MALPECESSPVAADSPLLQIAHRCAIVGLFLTVAAIATRYFHEDAALLMPLAMLASVLALAISAPSWYVSRRMGRRASESRGLTIFSAVLLLVELALHLLGSAGKP